MLPESPLLLVSSASPLSTCPHPAGRTREKAPTRSSPRPRMATSMPLFWPWYGDTHPNEAGVGWEELPPVPGTAAALRTPEAVTTSR